MDGLALVVAIAYGIMDNLWFEAFTVLINSTILIVVVRLVRKFSRIELKVEMMWSVFEKRFKVGHDGD